MAAPHTPLVLSLDKGQLVGLGRCSSAGFSFGTHGEARSHGGGEVRYLGTFTVVDAFPPTGWFAPKPKPCLERVAVLPGWLATTASNAPGGGDVAHACLLSPTHTTHSAWERGSPGGGGGGGGVPFATTPQCPHPPNPPPTEVAPGSLTVVYQADSRVPPAGIVISLAPGDKSDALDRLILHIGLEQQKIRYWVLETPLPPPGFCEAVRAAVWNEFDAGRTMALCQPYFGVKYRNANGAIEPSELLPVVEQLFARYSAEVPIAAVSSPPQLAAAAAGFVSFVSALSPVSRVIFRIFSAVGPPTSLPAFTALTTAVAMLTADQAWQPTCLALLTLLDHPSASSVGEAVSGHPAWISRSEAAWLTEKPQSTVLVPHRLDAIGASAVLGADGRVVFLALRGLLDASAVNLQDVLGGFDKIEIEYLSGCCQSSDEIKQLFLSVALHPRLLAAGKDGLSLLSKFKLVTGDGLSTKHDFQEVLRATLTPASLSGELSLLFLKDVVYTFFLDEHIGFKPDCSRIRFCPGVLLFHALMDVRRIPTLRSRLDENKGTVQLLVEACLRFEALPASNDRQPVLHACVALRAVEAMELIVLFRKYAEALCQTNHDFEKTPTVIKLELAAVQVQPPVYVNQSRPAASPPASVASVLPSAPPAFDDELLKPVSRVYPPLEVQSWAVPAAVPPQVHVAGEKRRPELVPLFRRAEDPFFPVRPHFTLRDAFNHFLHGYFLVTTVLDVALLEQQPPSAPPRKGELLQTLHDDVMKNVLQVRMPHKSGAISVLRNEFVSALWAVPLGVSCHYLPPQLKHLALSGVDLFTEPAHFEPVLVSQLAMKQPLFSSPLYPQLVQAALRLKERDDFAVHVDAELRRNALDVKLPIKTGHVLSKVLSKNVDVYFVKNAVTGQMSSEPCFHFADIALCADEWMKVDETMDRARSSKKPQVTALIERIFDLPPQQWTKVSVCGGGGSVSSLLRITFVCEVPAWHLHLEAVSPPPPFLTSPPSPRHTLSGVSRRVLPCAHDRVPEPGKLEHRKSCV